MSLQPGSGSGHDPFVEQAVLVHLQHVARSVLGHYTIGVLVGQRFDCPLTHTRYGVISSLIEGEAPIRHETALSDGFHRLRSQSRAEPPLEILGSYCIGQAQRAVLSGSHADVHAAWLSEPWHVAVVVAEAATSGAFFLHDSRNARWYQTPFHEVTRPLRGSGGSKATCIAWPDYMTTEAVVPLARTQESTPPIQKMPRVGPQRHADTSPNRSLWRSLLANTTSHQSQEGDGRPRRSNTIGPTPTHDAPSVSRPTATSDQSRLPSTHTGGQPVTDADDTTTSDTPERYLELARNEGFFITAKFDGSDPDAHETVWVLNEPYSGLLLTLVATDTQVVDASLHYNLHAEDAAVLNATFPEHRDLRSGTVYMREWCVDRLRARCKRLRAAGTLEREWNVAPTVYLLTPTEWESEIVDADTRGADEREVLNRRRIDLLPEAVRRQFCLVPQRHRLASPEAEEHAG